MHSPSCYLGRDSHGSAAHMVLTSISLRISTIATFSSSSESCLPKVARAISVTHCTPSVSTRTGLQRASRRLIRVCSSREDCRLLTTDCCREETTVTMTVTKMNLIQDHSTCMYMMQTAEYTLLSDAAGYEHPIACHTVMPWPLLIQTKALYTYNL